MYDILPNASLLKADNCFNRPDLTIRKRSSVQYALSLPEVVSHVLSYFFLELDTLLACLYVNRLFSAEATRVIWRRCGQDWTQDHLVIYERYRPGTNPRVSDLCKIASRDKKRAQLYATYIRQLYVSCAGSNRTANRDDMNQWRDIMEELQFPKLSILAVEGYSGPEAEKTIIQLTRWKPRELILDDGLFSFQELQRMLFQSQSLTWLILQGRLYTPQLAELLCRLPQLSRFAISERGRGSPNLWTRYGLSSVLNHPSLESVNLRGVNIPEDWLEGLSLSQRNSSWFPRLREVSLMLSKRAFELLIPSIQAITALDIFFIENPALRGDASILQLVSRLRHLETVRINSDMRQPIDGRDIIRFAGACPNIRTWVLSIPSYRFVRAPRDDSNRIMEFVEVSDAILEEVFKRWPKLETFGLTLPRHREISFKSLDSVAKYCPGLESFWIFANINFRKLVQSSQSFYLPKLHTLQITTQKPVRYQNHLAIARELRKRLPSNVYFREQYPLDYYQDAETLLSKAFNSLPSVGKRSTR